MRERAKEADPGLSWGLEVVLERGPGLAELLAGATAGASGPFHQLTQMWGRKERGASEASKLSAVRR